MVVSAAKLEANRRNALKSTGPRTQEGKDRSKMNAVTHGCRAETLIVHDEDLQELEARRQAWIADLAPRSDAEQRAVEDAVSYSWRQDRARRAEVALADARLADHDGDGDTSVEQQVTELGRRLFLDRLGPIEFYPTGIDDPEMGDREASTSLAGAGKLDPDDPAILVLRLKSTLEGCEWILGEWAKLKKALDRGQSWLSSDKLKAVRLLGKQPLDAIDDEDVAMVFLASFVLKPDRGKWYWEISMELIDDDTDRFRKNAATRQLQLLMPADVASARDALRALIDRATEPLTAKAEAFRERARIKAALAADILAFDPSVEAERLRRHELASGRAMARSLDTLFKLRRAPEAAESSVVSGRNLSVVGCALPIADGEGELVAKSIAPNEATGGCRIATIEPTDEEIDTTWAQEIDTNEATDGPVPAVNCPLSGVVCEPCENVTNEPTDGPLSAVSGTLSENAAASEDATNEANAVHEAVTNEATGAGKNLTNEANAGDGELQAPIDGGTVLEPVTAGITTETTDEALKRIRRTREEDVRKLNERARKEVELAMAARRAHRAERREQRMKVSRRAGTTGPEAGHTGQIAINGFDTSADLYMKMDAKAKTQYLRGELEKVKATYAAALQKFVEQDPSFLEKALSGRGSSRARKKSKNAAAEDRLEQRVNFAELVKSG
jgi:hypothetical protein